MAVMMAVWMDPQVSLAATVPQKIVPNDTFFDRQWALQDVRAQEAWTVTTSSEQVVVALIDGGVDDSHPDLKNALWSDPDEIAGNGKDDDMDGMIDDTHGWNFALNSSNTRPIASVLSHDGAWIHGTAVASLIVGRGNDDIGMAGVAWRAKLMPLVILDSDGSGGTDRLVSAIRYAVAHRADIINMSVEGDVLDEGVSSAIKEATAKGILVVIAAGNGKQGVGSNLTEKALYPSCNKGAADQSVLVVSGYGRDGKRVASANYGDCVNIAAPGEDILSARPTYEPDGNRQDVSGYGYWTGTSLAAPLVSGVAALLKSQHPSWNGEQLARRILDSAKPFTDVSTSAGMGVGKVDAASALSASDSRVYGPWLLSASVPGQSPRVWIKDETGRELYSLPVGNAGDRRGIRAAFVRWDADRHPDVIVTAIGDEAGAWRVYRTDGVLLAAGTVSRTQYDRVKGGLAVTTQDVDASGRDRLLFTEAAGNRVWSFAVDKPDFDSPIKMTDDPNPLGVLAVGLERPTQTFLTLIRAKGGSSLAIYDQGGFIEGTSVTTTKPSALEIMSGVTRDGRSLIRMVQSGPPSYLVERNGVMMSDPKAVPWKWTQAPLGFRLDGSKDRLFYDAWPR